MPHNLNKITNPELMFDVCQKRKLNQTCLARLSHLRDVFITFQSKLLPCFSIK